MRREKRVCWPAANYCTKQSLFLLTILPDRKEGSLFPGLESDLVGAFFAPGGGGQATPDSPKAHTPDCSALWGWVPGKTFVPCLSTRGQSAHLRQRSPRWNKIAALWPRRFKGATINTPAQSTGAGGCSPSAQSSPSRRAQRVDESVERKQASWVLLPRQKSSWPAPPPSSPTAEGPSRIPSGKAEPFPGGLGAAGDSGEALFVQWQKRPWQRAPPHP